MDIKTIRKQSDKYRVMQFAYDFLGVIGVLTMLVAKLSNILLMQERLYIVIGALLLWICVIGNRYYSFLERESIKEERKEARRLLNKEVS